MNSAKKKQAMDTLKKIGNASDVTRFWVDDTATDKERVAAAQAKRERKAERAKKLELKRGFDAF